MGGWGVGTMVVVAMVAAVQRGQRPGGGLGGGGVQHFEQLLAGIVMVLSRLADEQGFAGGHDGSVLGDRWLLVVVLVFAGDVR